MERTLIHLYETLGGAPCLFGYAGGFPDEHTARLIELVAPILPVSDGAPRSTDGRIETPTGPHVVLYGGTPTPTSLNLNHDHATTSHTWQLVCCADQQLSLPTLLCKCGFDHGTLGIGFSVACRVVDDKQQGRCRVKAWNGHCKVLCVACVCIAQAIGHQTGPCR